MWDKKSAELLKAVQTIGIERSAVSARTVKKVAALIKVPEQKRYFAMRHSVSIMVKACRSRTTADLQ